MDSTQLTSFKLAGLRAGNIAQAAAQNSTLVRTAMRLDSGRKTAKLAVKRFLKRLKTPCTSPGNKLRILVHIRGGIGDVCMSRIFIQKLRETLPQAEISFAYDNKAVVDAVFPDGLIDRFEPTDYLPERFDVVISGCHFLMYDFINRARVAQLAPQFVPVLDQGLAVQACFKPFATYSPHLDGQLAEIAIVHGGSRITNLGWFTGLEIHQNDLSSLTLDPALTDRVLEKLALNGKPYVTIHDGINTNTDTSLGHPTRCWPESHWREFAALFKAEFPDIALVQLGGNKSHRFDFADISLVGKTELADLPHILKKACLHIDGESGMVHLANLTQTPCVVLFGPSKAAYLGYARNTNISSPVCGGCMNISKNWMTQCILGFPPQQQCLSAISARQVFEAVHTRLQS